MALFKLTRLQEIDKRLMELESFKGDLPEQVDNLMINIARLKEDLFQSKQELDVTKKLNRTLELDIRSLQDQLKKYQNQLFAVKTNKEYDAITVEIENIERKIEAAELKAVELLEREEKLTAESRQFEEQLTNLDQNLRDLEFELQQKLDQTEAEQKLLLGQREEILPTIDRRLLASYERIRKGRDGIAIAEVENYTCNACYTTIPAQTVQEIRKMDRMINCEVCGRILVYVNNQVEQPIAAHTERLER